MFFKFLKSYFAGDASTFIGNPGDLTVNSDGTSLSVHDGSTPGGNAVGSGGGAPSVLLNTYNTDPDGESGNTITIDFTVTGSNIASGGIMGLLNGFNNNDDTPLYMFDTVTGGEQVIVTPMTANGGTGYYTIFVTNDVGTGYSYVFSVQNGECFVQGTMISMADGSLKAIEDITYDDDILVWDFDNGMYASSNPIWIKIEELTEKYNVLTFSDGTVLKTVGNHHIFNKASRRFTHTMRDDTPLGTTTMNVKDEEVVLVSQETVYETVKQYNVWTNYHLNMFANGILTSNRFNNTYPIENMEFVKDVVSLRPVEEFFGIDEKWITGLRLREQTSEHSQEYIHWYVNRLERKLSSSKAKDAPVERFFLRYSQDTREFVQL